jgi:PBP1b-binding outer membrane lipoprotein LpoB
MRKLGLYIMLAVLLLAISGCRLGQLHPYGESAPQSEAVTQPSSEAQPSEDVPTMPTEGTDPGGFGPIM